MRISFPRTAAIHNGAANVALRCLASAACAGQLVLQNARLRGAHQASAGLDAAGSAAHKTTSYGHASFKIAAGGHKVVNVHLSRAARARRRITAA